MSGSDCPSNHRELFVPEIGDQHQSRRMREREWHLCIRDHSLRSDAAGPEHRKFIRRDRHGIADINKPDYGDAVPVAADEIPVFWACGVTPQAVIAATKLPFAITHAPGLMLVTDLQNKQLAVL